MKTELIEKAYAIARERYAEIGVDTEKRSRRFRTSRSRSTAGRRTT